MFEFSGNHSMNISPGCKLFFSHSLSDQYLYVFTNQEITILKNHILHLRSKMYTKGTVLHENLENRRKLSHNL